MTIRVQEAFISILPSPNERGKMERLCIFSTLFDPLNLKFCFRSISFRRITSFHSLFNLLSNQSRPLEQCRPIALCIPSSWPIKRFFLWKMFSNICWFHDLSFSANILNDDYKLHSTFPSWLTKMPKSGWCNQADVNLDRRSPRGYHPLSSRQGAGDNDWSVHGRGVECWPKGSNSLIHCHTKLDPSVLPSESARSRHISMWTLAPSTPKQSAQYY